MRSIQNEDCRLQTEYKMYTRYKIQIADRVKNADWEFILSFRLIRDNMSSYNLPSVTQSIVRFTVVCLVAKPLNRNEAKGDLVMIQTLLLFKCKLLCYHANWILVSITTRSLSASLQIKGLATKYTIVKWPIFRDYLSRSFALMWNIPRPFLDHNRA